MDRHPALTSAQRLAVARIQGTIAWLTPAAGRELDRQAALMELHSESRDPVVLGHVLGLYLARSESGDAYPYGVAIDLLRMAGADEEAAAAKLAWLHARYPGRMV